MGYREARELARLRHELRERLLTHKSDGSDLLLARFRHAVEIHGTSVPELHSEYERWRVRFELLGGAHVSAA